MALLSLALICNTFKASIVKAWLENFYDFWVRFNGSKQCNTLFEAEVKLQKQIGTESVTGAYNAHEILALHLHMHLKRIRSHATALPYLK